MSAEPVRRAPSSPQSLAARVRPYAGLLIVVALLIVVVLIAPTVAP